MQTVYYTKSAKYVMRALLFAGLSLFSVSHVVAQGRESVTDEVDQFVLKVFDRVQLLSFRNGVEYCGLIGYDKNDNLIATPAIKGEVDGCHSGEDPDGLEVIASYHTHGAATHEADTEASSPTDLEADIEERLDGYIATPGGRVWFNDSREKISFLLCGLACVKSDPKFKECEALKPNDSYTLKELLQREENDTGEC